MCHEASGLHRDHFYSRPCGRGDGCCRASLPRSVTFLLTPLREGRRAPATSGTPQTYFYSRPCGRGDCHQPFSPLAKANFYSRPCGRGDSNFPQVRHEVLRQIAER